LTDFKYLRTVYYIYTMKHGYSSD